MKQNCLLLLSLFLVCCCRQSTLSVPEVQLDPKILTDAVALNATLYCDTDSLIQALFFMVYQDSVLIVKNRENPKAKWVELYNLNSGKCINRLIDKGNGPDEAIIVDVDLCGDELFVDDFQKRKIVRLDLNQIVDDPNYQLPPFFSYSAGGDLITGIKFLKSDSLLCINPYYFKNDELDIDNDEPLFLKLPVPPKVPPKRSKWFAFNVNQGPVVLNERRDRIVYASRFEDLIAIADCNGKELLRLLGPGETGTEYYKDTSWGKSLSVWKGIPEAYTSATYDDDYFYVTYCGKRWSKEAESYDFESWILKFDWDGIFQKSYHFDRYIDNLTLSSQYPETFYATGYDSDGVPEVLKLTVSQ